MDIFERALAKAQLERERLKEKREATQKERPENVRRFFHALTGVFNK